MYDLKLIPIHQEKGQPIPQQRGFTAARPPRRAARSREDDMLILSLIINGDAQAVAELHDSWLEKFVEPFFKTSGSVTSALRSFIETLNLTMMEKNLKGAGAGAAVTGAINLAAVHRRAVYIAQSGDPCLCPDPGWTGALPRCQPARSRPGFEPHAQSVTTRQTWVPEATCLCRIRLRPRGHRTIV